MARCIIPNSCVPFENFIKKIYSYDGEKDSEIMANRFSSQYNFPSWESTRSMKTQCLRMVKEMSRQQNILHAERLSRISISDESKKRKNADNASGPEIKRPRHDFASDNCQEIIKHNSVFFHTLYYLDLYGGSVDMNQEGIDTIFSLMRLALKWNMDVLYLEEHYFQKYLIKNGYFTKPDNNNSKKIEKRMINKLGYNVAPLCVPEIYEALRTFLLSKSENSDEYKLIAEDFVLIAYVIHTSLSEVVTVVKRGLAFTTLFCIIISYISVSICFSYQWLTELYRFKKIIEVEFLNNQSIISGINFSQFNACLGCFRSTTASSIKRNHLYLSPVKEYIFDVIKEGMLTAASEKHLLERSFTGETLKVISTRTRSMELCYPVLYKRMPKIFDDGIVFTSTTIFNVV
jgi:hypothetical protein